VRYLPDKKIAVQIAQKICEGQPPKMFSECSRFHPNLFNFGRVIAECVNTAISPRKVNPLFGRSLALGRIIITVSILVIFEFNWSVF